ncbi:unnamed protein product [Closterium sp. Naga37s-1]|nr:unnamed protein product [Closterium sp. Naga37s-1]
MASIHNSDAVMTDEQLAAGDDTLTDLGDYVLEDLPDGALPELHGEPATKKLCGEGTSSSAATAPSSSQPVAPPRPRSAPGSRPQPQVQAAVTEQAAAGSASSLALTVRYRNLRYRNLRHHRPSVGSELRSLTRDTQSLVTVMFPECSEEVRESILARIAASLTGPVAFNGAVPHYDAAASDPLRLLRKTYFRHIYAWPSAYDARIFRSLFSLTVRLANSRPIEVKVFIDPYPEYATAKARGETYLVMRNVPLGVTQECMRATLLGGETEDKLPWLADLLHFHRLKDPYGGSAYSQMLGLPVAAEGDPSFKRIPAQPPSDGPRLFRTHPP